MGSFHFYHPIEVRYSDLDPQGHLNNACYLTYFEQARIAYVAHLGVWKPGDFNNIGIILADAHITFRAAVQFGQKIQVGVRVSRIGNKSLDMEYELVDGDTGRVMAVGSTVLVAYAYAGQTTIPVPENWRDAIRRVEQSEAA